MYNAAPSHMEPIKKSVLQGLIGTQEAGNKEYTN